MPLLTRNKKPVKMLLMGDPGAGKTGALASLACADYELFIYDYENLLEVLAAYTEKKDPEKLKNIRVQTFTDKLAPPREGLVQMVGASMRVPSFAKGSATAFTRSLKQLERWKNEEDGDLGDPATWGNKRVVVIDSLTSMSNSAFRLAQTMNPGAKEPQTYYGVAQALVINTLELLGAEEFNTNVIVIAHIDYDKNELGLQKGFPKSIGSALNTVIAGKFNAVLLAESMGSKRQIRTNSNGIIELKNPTAAKVPDILPLDTGLADYFRLAQS